MEFNRSRGIPGWHECLGKQYDDALAEWNKLFQEPFYKKGVHLIQHIFIARRSSRRDNDDQHEQFQKYAKSRVYTAWNPNLSRAKRYD